MRGGRESEKGRGGVEVGEKNGRGKREEMHFCAGLKDQWIFLCVNVCVCVIRRLD